MRLSPGRDRSNAPGRPLPPFAHTEDSVRASVRAAPRRSHFINAPIAADAGRGPRRLCSAPASSCDFGKRALERAADRSDKRARRGGGYGRAAYLFFCCAEHTFGGPRQHHAALRAPRAVSPIMLMRIAGMLFASTIRSSLRAGPGATPSLHPCLRSDVISGDNRLNLRQVRTHEPKSGWGKGSPARRGHYGTGRGRRARTQRPKEDPACDQAAR